MSHPRIIVFVVALTVRLSWCLSPGEAYIPSDGVAYHNIAVNLSRGNGYSLRMSQPYEPYFFREPLYPVFLSIVYKTWSSIGGYVGYLDDQTPAQSRGDIMVARLAQAAIGAATCVLIYNTLALVLTSTWSLWISMAIASYIPLVVFSSLLMRETLQTFLVMAMNWAVSHGLVTRRLNSFVIAGILWGLSNLTLQITIFSGLLCFPAIYLQTRQWGKAVKTTLGMVVVMSAVMTPWLVRTYLFYHDARILKSLGTSLTHEAARFLTTVQYRQEAGLRDSRAQSWPHWYYSLSEEDKFRLSFDGTLDRMTDTIASGSRHGGVDEFMRFVTLFRTGWMESLWIETLPGGRIHMRPHTLYFKDGQTLLFALSLLAMAWGYLSLLGVARHATRMSPTMLLFIYFVLIIPWISSEPRRTLPIHPFIIAFSMLASISIVEKIWKKKIVLYKEDLQDACKNA